MESLEINTNLNVVAIIDRSISISITIYDTIRVTYDTLVSGRRWTHRFVVKLEISLIVPK